LKLIKANYKFATQQIIVMRTSTWYQNIRYFSE